MGLNEPRKWILRQRDGSISSSYIMLVFLMMEWVFLLTFLSTDANICLTGAFCQAITRPRCSVQGARDRIVFTKYIDVFVKREIKELHE